MNKHLAIGVVGVLLAMLLCGNALGECRLTVKEVQSQINHNGAKKVLWELFSDWKGRWYPLMECISSGERAWLDIAAELAPYSDAGPSEDINIYLGKALASNAENVLRTKLPSDGFSDFCAWLDDDPPADMTDTQLDEWYLADLNARLAGLALVRSPDLADSVANCREQVQNDIEKLKVDMNSHGKQ